MFYNDSSGKLMTWDNYGKGGWELDHIIPLIDFNLQNREEFLRAVHFTNIQPLWRLDNINKRNHPKTWVHPKSIAEKARVVGPTKVNIKT